MGEKVIEAAAAAAHGRNSIAGNGVVARVVVNVVE